MFVKRAKHSNPPGATALHAACNFGHIGVVRYLLSDNTPELKKINVNIMDEVQNPKQKLQKGVKPISIKMFLHVLTFVFSRRAEHHYGWRREKGSQIS